MAASALALLLTGTNLPGTAHAESPKVHKPASKHAHKTPVIKPPHAKKAVRPATASKGAKTAKAAAVAGVAAGATAAAAAADKDAPPKKGSDTGLPIPRFVALRSDEVNMRVGPDTRYPIEWVYKRRNLPVEIVREFQVWRLVKDPDGIKGWMHQATLTGRRTFMVIGGEQKLRESKDVSADVIALLKPGVIGRILECDSGSEACRVQVHDYRGYLNRSAMWGILPGEVIGAS